MKKRFSIFHFLIIVMLFSLMLPATIVDASRGGSGPGKGPGKGSNPTGSLTIHKYAVEQGYSGGEAGDGTAGQKNNIPEDATLLQGVTFKITQTHTFDPSNDEWSNYNGQSNVIQRTTNANGQANFSNLPLGRYKVEEVSGPSHIILNDEIFHVDIPMINQNKNPNYNVHIYPKNETINGAVELTKVDGDNNDPLSGVKFELYNATTNTIVKHNGVSQFQTDSNGKIQIDGLPFGNYYFKEVSTVDGYVISNKKVNFTINKSGYFTGAKSHGKIAKVKVENYKKPSITKKVDKEEVDRGEIVTYTLTIDIPKNIKDYQSFSVTDVLDQDLEYVSNSEQSPYWFNFNRTGKTLTWTANPSKLTGPGQVEITFKAKVNKNTSAEVINNIASIKYKDKTKKKGSDDSNNTVISIVSKGIKIIKVDGDNNSIRLKGAQFKLTTDKAGTNIINATGKGIRVNGILHYGKLENLTTNNDGEITIDGLNTDTYYLHETKAPTYNDGGEIKSYNLLTKPMKVTLKKGDSKTITVKNYKSGWELPKTGGAGSLLFTLIGLSLMGIATFMILRRRRTDLS